MKPYEDYGEVDPEIDKLRESLRKNKATDVINDTAMRLEIRNQQEKIRELCAIIGRAYVNLHPHDPEDELREGVEGVLEAQNIIDGYHAMLKRQNQDFKKKIEEESGVKCPYCLTKNKTGSKFCTRCGSSLEIKEAVPPFLDLEAKVFCKACGIRLLPQSMFCTCCGTKVTD